MRAGAHCGARYHQHSVGAPGPWAVWVRCAGMPERWATTACVGHCIQPPACQPAHTLPFQRCLLRRGLRDNMECRETPWRHPFAQACTV